MDKIFPDSYPYPEFLRPILLFSSTAAILLLATFFLTAATDQAQPVFLLTSALCISLTLLVISLGIFMANQHYREDGGQGYLLPGKYFNMHVQDRFSYGFNLVLYTLSGIVLAIFSLINLVLL